MRLILLVLLSLWSGLAIAADTTIEMLNKFDKEYMVFSKKLVYIDSGDTVFWKATDKGHNVEFVKGAVPTGVKAFKSKLNVDTEYKFSIPGIYAKFVLSIHVKFRFKSFNTSWNSSFNKLKIGRASCRERV